MKLLEDRIREEGVVKEGNILKVDMFLNHQMDVVLFRQMAKEWKRRFADAGVNKILTIEASGIGIACIAAEEFGCKVVFAKKTQGKNLDGDLLTTQITSFTKGRVFDVIVAKKFLGPEDRVLIIDDFLANGCALEGLISIVKESGATLVGCGIAIEKGFQAGGDKIRGMGVRLESLAIIESMDGGKLTFREDGT
ncbi:MAG: xanthine phosphoribosyltransferase [Lachnospiraceae bacterium]|nr:xanthine phosphoribosyltransferase [Lachnospiraceae bacterium]MBO4697095.1 xanthine phosphoribosyltransferase [Lachnospiraceae bacterium]